MPDENDYDWRIDAYASWLLALEELHRAAVDAGIVPPRNDADDQAWLEARMNAGRWTAYALKMQCKICGEPLYAHEEDARSDIEHILSISDVTDAESLREAMSWLPNGGKYCDGCADAGGG